MKLSNEQQTRNVINRLSSIGRKDYIFDAETLKMLNERMERHEKGLSKSYTVEESFERARSYKKNRDAQPS